MGNLCSIWFVYTFAHKFPCVHVCSCTPWTHVHEHTHTQTHTHTLTHKNTHTHSLMCFLLQALFYLAQVPSNRPLMKNEMGLLISVRRIINRFVYTHKCYFMAVYTIMYWKVGVYAVYMMLQ